MQFVHSIHSKAIKESQKWHDMYLNAHTYYSFQYGTLSIEELLSFASQNGIGELVLTDINSTSGTLNFIRMASDYNIKPIVGIDFRNGAKQKFIGIAKNNEGFRELNEYLSYHLHDEKDFPDIAPEFRHSYVIYPFCFSFNKELRENEFVGIRPQDIINLPLTQWKSRQEKLVILQTVSFKKSKIDFNFTKNYRNDGNI